MTPKRQSGASADVVRIGVIQRHPLKARRLERALARHSDFKVVAAWSNGQATLAALRDSRPDVIVIELQTQSDDEWRLLGETVDARLGVPIVIATDSISDDAVAAAMRLEVSGLVVDGEAADVANCVREVSRGRLCLDQGVIRGALARFAERDSAAREAAKLLTPREIEIIRLVAARLTNKEISARLFVAEGTVKVHLHNIFHKLQARRRQDLAEYGRKNGLV